LHLGKPKRLIITVIVKIPNIKLRISPILLLKIRKYICIVVKYNIDALNKINATRFFQHKYTAMINPSIETELVGTLKFLDSHQKSDVLSFIKEKLGVRYKSIVKREALRDIRLSLSGRMAF